MSNWFTRKLDEANNAAASFIDDNLGGRPAFLREAPPPSAAIQTATERAEDAANIAAITVGVDVRTEAVASTQPEREQQMARSRRANETNDVVLTSADTVNAGARATGRFLDRQIEGVDELFTGSRSDAAVRAYMETKGRVDGIVARGDDNTLMQEYQRALTGRMEVLERRMAEANGRGDEAAAAAARAQIESTRQLASVHLEPGARLSAEQREAIAQTTKLTAGLNANAEIQRLTGRADAAAVTIENGMIAAAQAVANFAAPGVGGLVITQAVGIADQAGVMGNPIEGERRHGGAIAMTVTGNAENVTWRDVVRDGIDVGLAAIPGGSVAASGKSAAGGAATTALRDRATGLVRSRANSQLREAGGDAAATLLTQATGSERVADAFARGPAPSPDAPAMPQPDSVAAALPAAPPITNDQAVAAAGAMADYMEGRGTLEAALRGQETFARYLDERVQVAINEGNVDRLTDLLGSQERNNEMRARLEERGTAVAAAPAQPEPQPAQPAPQPAQAAPPPRQMVRIADTPVPAGNEGLRDLLASMVNLVQSATGMDVNGMLAQRPQPERVPAVQPATPQPAVVANRNTREGQREAIINALERPKGADGVMDRREARAVMNRMDANGDGVVSGQEARQALSRASGVNITKDMMKDPAIVAAMAGFRDSLAANGVTFDRGNASMPSAAPATQVATTGRGNDGTGRA